MPSGCSCPSSRAGHDGATWAILVALGFFGGLGQLFMTSALRFAPVSAVVPFDYSQLLWAVLFGWLFWGTPPHGATWAGAAVIIGSGLYTSIANASWAARNRGRRRSSA